MLSYMPLNAMTSCLQLASKFVNMETHLAIGHSRIVDIFSQGQGKDL